MSLAQQIVNDLGVNGATPNIYQKLKNLEDDVQNIQEATTQLVNGSQNQPPGSATGAAIRMTQQALA